MLPPSLHGDRQVEAALPDMRSLMGSTADVEGPAFSHPESAASTVNTPRQGVRFVSVAPARMEHASHSAAIAVCLSADSRLISAISSEARRIGLTR